METDNQKAQGPTASQREVGETREETMEEWFAKGGSDIEEGEVVRGLVVEVRGSEVLVDIGYKSEGTIAIEEFRHTGVPKVGDEIEVYLEAKEDNEGLIVLSKDKADKIKVWDAVSRSFDSGTPVEGRVVEVVKGGLAVDVGDGEDLDAAGGSPAHQLGGGKHPIRSSRVAMEIDGNHRNGFEANANHSKSGLP